MSDKYRGSARLPDYFLLFFWSRRLHKLGFSHLTVECPAATEVFLHLLSSTTRTYLSGGTSRCQDLLLVSTPARVCI
jgi:hypothetical protein